MNTYTEAGDIILIRGAAKASSIISIATRGRFSHACVVISKTRAIEAIFDGVQVTSLIRFAFENERNIRVFRPKFESEAQKESVQKHLEDFAHGHQGKGYNIVDAAKSILGLRFKVNDENLFCSQLVAALFRQAGFPLFTKLDHNVNPNDYTRSCKLIDITTKAVCLISEEVIRRAAVNGDEIRAIDNNSGASTSSPHAKLLREFIEESATIFLKHNLPKPNRSFDIIDQLTDPKNHSIAVELDKELADLYESKDINRALQDASKSDAPKDISFYKKEYIDYGERFATQQYQYCLQIGPAYIKRMQQNLIHRDVYSQVHQKLGFKYALHQVTYYDIVIRAAVFIISEVGKQIEAYEELYSNE